MSNQFRVPTDKLYYHVDAKELPFKTTKDVTNNLQIFGHDVAKDALTFAIECLGKGLNAYVRGMSGTGRETLVKQVLDEVKPKARQQNDYCYVHNFTHPNIPRLIVLKHGYGKILKKMMAVFCDYVVSELQQTLSSEDIRSKRVQIENKHNKILINIYQPFEDILKKENLALANIKDGESMRMVIAPVHKDVLITPEQIPVLLKQGELSEKDIIAFNKKVLSFQPQLETLVKQANFLTEKKYQDIRKLDNDFARAQLSCHLDAISEKFKYKDLDIYLDEIVDDFIENVLYNRKGSFDPTMFYGVNILTPTYKDDKAPVVFESSPTLVNLLGIAEREGKLPPYASISAGSLIKSDGGFLIIEVDEALAEKGTWAILMRTIRSGKLSFSFEDYFGGRPSTIKPEPIPLDVKVILIGSHQRFYELGHYEDDFLDNFKVLVDLDTELPRIAESFMQYAQVLKKVVNDEKLLHFDNGAVAQMIEHGIRLSSGKNKLSTRFGRLMDVAREASYLAKKEKKNLVVKKYVVNAIKASIGRSYSSAKRFYELLENGTIIIENQGKQIGQINGLAVSQAGTISYGFPARITATVSPGKSGLINIEGQAELSGNIHTKGFQILGGLLRHILRPCHPLSFSASIAFEQSYGGIDGDSASGAEACCLLSAITQIPIKQSLSMTGAIDQFGQLQAIGGVNEKIEGFFDYCHQGGLNGEQGVIIPSANLANLMLRDDVVKACEKNDFHIYAVGYVLDALAILTDTESCQYELAHRIPYSYDSTLFKASENIQTLFEQSMSLNDGVN